MKSLTNESMALGTQQSQKWAGWMLTKLPGSPLVGDQGISKYARSLLLPNQDSEVMRPPADMWTNTQTRAFSLFKTL